jgi:hypothetical protein
VFGLPAVVIPHYNNAEGGHHDTRYCYLGEQRLAMMERSLPTETFILGVDEHTAVLLDPVERTATVAGNGVMTIRRAGRSVVHPAGSVVDFEALASGESGSGQAGRGSPIAGAGVSAGTGGMSAWSGGASAGAGAGFAGAVGTAADADPSKLAEAAAAPPSLRAAVTASAARFQAALEKRDVDACVEAILDLEQAILDWSADTLTSDEGELARAELRSMVVRLGELAAGAREPREVIRPFVEGLLDLRARAREARDWSSADLVRDRLKAAGVEVRDTPDGADWHLAPSRRSGA